MAENVSEIEGAKQRLAWYARQPGNAGLASDVAILLSTIEKQQKVIEAARELAECDPWYGPICEAHVVGLRSALVALEGKPREEPSHAH